MEGSARSESEPEPRLSSGQAAFAVMVCLGSWVFALFAASLGFLRGMVELHRSCPEGDVEKAWSTNAILLGVSAAALLLPQTLIAGLGLVQGLRSRRSRFAWAALALAVLGVALGVGAHLVPSTMAC